MVTVNNVRTVSREGIIIIENFLTEEVMVTVYAEVIIVGT